MADWNEPTTSTNYTTVLSELKGRDVESAQMFDVGTPTNVPTSAIRWNSANNRFEKWSGAVWNVLTSSYAIDAATIGGFGPSTFLKLNPGSDQSIISGKLTINTGSATPFDLKGGAADYIMIQFFADSAAQSTRSGYIGYSSAGSDDLTIGSEQGAQKVKIVGQLALTAGVTARASLNVPQGVAPTTPANGDIWTTGAGLYTRINGSTLLFGPNTVSKTGTPVANQVAYYNSANVIQGSSSFTWNGSALTVSGNVAATTFIGALSGNATTATSATSATTAGTVTTPAQPAITSVGTLSSLAVTGSITANSGRPVVPAIATISDHFRAGHVQLWDMHTNLSGGSMPIFSAITEATWTTVGPPGSGSTYEWSKLSVLPSQATILIVMANVYMPGSGSQGNIGIDVAHGDESTPLTGPYNRLVDIVHLDPGEGIKLEIMIPINSSGIFKMRYYDTSTANSADIRFYYRGFITD